MFVCCFIHPTDHQQRFNYFASDGVSVCISFSLHFSLSCFGLTSWMDGVKGMLHNVCFLAFIFAFCPSHIFLMGADSIICVCECNRIELNRIRSKYGKLLFGTFSLSLGREGIRCESPLLLDRLQIK